MVSHISRRLLISPKYFSLQPWTYLVMIECFAFYCGFLALSLILDYFQVRMTIDCVEFHSFVKLSIGVVHLCKEAG